MDRLAQLSERLAKVDEYRFVGAMQEDEIEGVLQISSRTVRRDWVKARAWLFMELYPEKLD